MNATSIITNLGLPQSELDLIEKMVELGSKDANGNPLPEKRTVYTRGECRKLAVMAAPSFGRTLTWAPAYIVKNDSARVSTPEGIARGLFDLSKFYFEEKVRKVRAPKEVAAAAQPVETLLDKVLAASANMPQSVESGALLDKVVESNPAELAAEVENASDVAGDANPMPEIAADETTKSKRAARKAKK